MKTPLVVRGMQGLGDNIHQRALLKQLMTEHDVWLESCWVAPYVDLIGQGLKIIRKPTPLRTQLKNAEREAKQFTTIAPPLHAPHKAVWYQPGEVRDRGGVLAAMCANTGCDYASADFRLPIPNAWMQRADALISLWNAKQPLLIYRPLVERKEWSGCAVRNPDVGSYIRILNSIRDKFFVVSIADLAPSFEWMTSPPIGANVTLHNGELDFEIMAALFARATLVFCSPGFAVILAQAVETPVICAFGRYERAYSFSGGARFSPYLGIEPINPCDDFKHGDNGDKTIDLSAAIPRASIFTIKALNGLFASPATV